LLTTYKNNRAIAAKPNGSGAFSRSPNFKIWLIEKKDNKKNLKIRLVFNRMVRAFFPPYYSYTITLVAI